MNQSVILGGARTPFGKLNGSLATVTAVELGTIALRGAIDRSSIDATAIEHIIFGQVLQAGAGQNPARQVGFGVDLPREVTSETINRVCGSGVRALALADNELRLGHQSVIAVGGMDSMSLAPYALPGARRGYRSGTADMLDLAIHDGLVSAQDGCLMGVHGSKVAAEEGVGRDEQDAFALRSHERALEAIDRGRLAREIVPVEVVGHKWATIVEVDEAPRRDTSLEALGKLKPAFGDGSSVTAGNAPGLNDGGAAFIVTSDHWAREHDAEPIATILAHGHAGWDPPYLAYTPAMATERALARAGLTIDQIDLFEINEAFASVPIVSARRLGVSLDRVNVNGGAIALGHPLAASGCRIVLTLIEELRERGGGLGVAAICSGGGLGDALVVRVDG